MNEDVQEVFDDIKTASRHLQAAVEKLKEIQNAYVLAAHNAEVLWDRAFLEADGTEQSKKSLANLASRQEKLRAAQLKGDVQMLKTDVATWQSILSGLQTTMSALREETRFARSGPGY